MSDNQISSFLLAIAFMVLGAVLTTAYLHQQGMFEQQEEEQAYEPVNRTAVIYVDAWLDDNETQPAIARTQVYIMHRCQGDAVNDLFKATTGLYWEDELMPNSPFEDLIQMRHNVTGWAQDLENEVFSQIDCLVDVKVPNIEIDAGWNP